MFASECLPSAISSYDEEILSSAGDLQRNHARYLAKCFFNS